MRKKSNLVVVIIVFLVVAGVLIIKNFADKKETHTNKLSEFAEYNQVDEESKTKLQKLDELTTYGYVGAGYMDVKSDGVEDIYNDYKKYGIIRSDQDGSLSYKGKRVREFIKEDEGWRYFDDIGTIDLHFNEAESKLEIISQKEFDERSLILEKYDDYCISQDMVEENHVAEELKEE